VVFHGPLALAEMMRMSSMPESTASCTTYWMVGVSMMGSISLGSALVAGKKRVPNPAAGITALRIMRKRVVYDGANINGKCHT
jgi:hypothetical protein